MGLRPCQTKVFAVRRLTGKPQIVSTSRHISQGGVDVINVQYNELTRVLGGVPYVVAGDEYVITAYNPFEKKAVEHTVKPDSTGEVEWQIRF